MTTRDARGRFTTPDALAADRVLAATAAGQATAYGGDEDYSRSRGWAGVA